jgi:cell division protein FtsQ
MELRGIETAGHKIWSAASLSGNSYLDEARPPAECVLSLEGRILQFFAEDRFRLGAAAKGARPPRANPPSWHSVLQRHADRAASAGFVLSMMFLAATALYALSLSDEAKPILSEAAAIADRAAYDAGFHLEDLALSGVRNAPQTAIFDALELPYKASSIFYDTAKANGRLLELGWIESATVRRILPRRLEVHVSERTPFGRWQDSSQTIQVIDQQGHVLGPDSEGRFAGLPLFAGEGAPKEAYAFEDALEDHAVIKKRIGSAELVAGRFWTVKLEGGLAVKLPHKVTPLALERLDSLLANPKIAEMALDTIDLRLSNRTILQLRDASEASRDRAIAWLSQDQAQVQAVQRRGKPL